MNFRTYLLDVFCKMNRIPMGCVRRDPIDTSTNKQHDITWPICDATEVRKVHTIRYHFPFASNYRIICRLARIMIFAMTEAIRKLFLRVTKSRVKIIALMPHEWQKSLFTLTHISIYFYTLLYIIYKLKQSIDHFALSPRTDLFDSRHHSWSLTSRKRQVLAFWRHIRRLFLHSQNWSSLVNDIVNNNFPPNGIHGLSSKKTYSAVISFLW